MGRALENGKVFVAVGWIVEGIYDVALDSCTVAFDLLEAFISNTNVFDGSF